MADVLVKSDRTRVRKEIEYRAHSRLAADQRSSSNLSDGRGMSKEETTVGRQVLSLGVGFFFYASSTPLDHMCAAECFARNRRPTTPKLASTEGFDGYSGGRLPWAGHLGAVCSYHQLRSMGGRTEVKSDGWAFSNEFRDDSPSA
ncbi:hypothetical protein CGCF415_v000480 [Colletotrichum fructicola]|nr:hypothetical protein CGCFRS4_v011953 [Colletotrichum fructicola]KAF4916692.1 hypothetical protein CGCF415_v000480 [Colletotrichum fructicola]KAF4940280.1 hypothetical protein CGCF245_v002642 [Colletotrichum fructicola]